MTQTLLQAARTGDERAFGELTDRYRRELQVHCYRMLGSVQDAEDALQDTLVAAWRGLEGFEERASVRAWLYRIATNRCLNLMRDAGRRPQRARAALDARALPGRDRAAALESPEQRQLVASFADAFERETSIASSPC